MTSHTLEQMDKLFVLGRCRRHGNNCALVWNVEDGFSIHLPPSVRQARHELVQLSDKVILDASNAQTNSFKLESVRSRSQ